MTGIIYYHTNLLRWLWACV